MWKVSFSGVGYPDIPMQGIWPLNTNCSRLKNGKDASRSDSGASVGIEQDSDLPYSYDIRFSKKSFTLEVYEPGYPSDRWASLQPDVAIMAFDISNRDTLTGLKSVSRSYLFFRAYFVCSGQRSTRWPCPPQDKV